MNLMAMLKGGTKAPANTLNYRKEYGDYISKAQVDGGEMLKWDDWMKKYYPSVPYVPGG